jgi:hypothetical protein
MYITKVRILPLDMFILKVCFGFSIRFVEVFYNFVFNYTSKF